MRAVQNLQKATVQDLVDRFNKIALAQFDAVWMLQNTRYTRLYREMERVCAELEAREGDQRRALLPLLQSDNVQVSMMAAHSLLTIAPELARQALESVSNSGVMPQAAEAGMSLLHLDDGTYVPK